MLGGELYGLGSLGLHEMGLEGVRDDCVLPITGLLLRNLN